MHIHGWTPDEYRTFYGLPKSGGRKGLLCADTFDSYSLRAREMAVAHRDEILARLAKYKGAANEACSRHVKPPYFEAGKNLGGYYAPVPQEAWDTFLRRVGAGRHPADVCTDADMPSHFYEHIAEDESFAEELARLCEALPFPVQAKHHTLGARFEGAVAELLATGMTQQAVAAELGVQQMTVSRHVRRPKTQKEGVGV